VWSRRKSYAYHTPGESHALPAVTCPHRNRRPYRSSTHQPSPPPSSVRNAIPFFPYVSRLGGAHGIHYPIQNQIATSTCDIDQRSGLLFRFYLSRRRRRWALLRMLDPYAVARMHTRYSTCVVVRPGRREIFGKFEKPPGSAVCL
jgi:hypothetical protein